ncbi:uncharacterized protein LOC119684783 [Teleopsis dalmanni]|nr:uncharacterized protein LOC119684783 [Teleopsis dalmanni]
MDYHAGKIKGADVKENLKCTNKCFLIKNGFMDESGKFMPEVFKTKMAGMDPKVLTEGLEKCKGKEAANVCEKAFLISDCFLQIKLQG